MFQCRTELAALLGAAGPEQVVFTPNATYALNLAIRTLVKPGDTVLISGWEHNAVTRTLHSMEDVQIRVAEAPLFDDAATVAAFRAALAQRPDCVICTCVSNVFGFILPVEEIAAVCREQGVPLILDAAQAAGCLPLDLEKLGAHFLAVPGHKGLYGPQGTGALLAGSAAPPLVPLVTGGTGSQSLEQQMPDFLPDRGEAGTQNVAGVSGLLEGIRFVRRLGVQRIHDHETMLLHRLCLRLSELPGVQLYQSPWDNQSGVLSFVPLGRDSELVAQQLGERGIGVRGGLHCAPLAHRSGGTMDSGTVRVSFSAFNRPDEVDAFAHVLGQIFKTN
jgi:selenocysteine lyase/cysteine desulfurase